MVFLRRHGDTVLRSPMRSHIRYPEVNMNNKLYRGIREAGVLLDGTIGAQFEDQLQPLAHEPVIVKKRVSAHYGTELPLLLKALHASEVVRSNASY